MRNGRSKVSAEDHLQDFALGINSKSMFFRLPKVCHLRAMFSAIHPDLHPCYIAKMVLYFS